MIELRFERYAWNVYFTNGIFYILYNFLISSVWKRRRLILLEGCNYISDSKYISYECLSTNEYNMKMTSLLLIPSAAPVFTACTVSVLLLYMLFGKIVWLVLRNRSTSFSWNTYIQNNHYGDDAKLFMIHCWI